MEVELVPISWLKPHEEVKPGNVESLYDITLRWNAYTKPLLVDGRTGTILDGHHRYHVGLRIGLVRLPVIKVDYSRFRTAEEMAAAIKEEYQSIANVRHVQFSGAKASSKEQDGGAPIAARE